MGGENAPWVSPVSGNEAVASRTSASARQVAEVHRSERSSAAIAPEITWYARSSVAERIASDTSTSRRVNPRRSSIVPHRPLEDLHGAVERVEAQGPPGRGAAAGVGEEDPGLRNAAAGAIRDLRRQVEGPVLPVDADSGHREAGGGRGGGGRPSRVSRFPNRERSYAASDSAERSRNTVSRSGSPIRESRGTATHRTRPSTNRTTESSTSVKPRLLLIPRVDVRILAFAALRAVRAVGADVVVAVAPGVQVHVRVSPGVLRHAVHVPALPVVLRYPAGVGDPDQRLDPLFGGRKVPVVQLVQPEGLLDVPDLDARLGLLRILGPSDQLGHHQRRQQAEDDDDDHDFDEGEPRPVPELPRPFSYRLHPVPPIGRSVKRRAGAAGSTRR